MTNVVDQLVLEALLKIAQQHGEDSDPDHEVGDLQDLLRPMWALLTTEQRAAFLATDEVRNVLDGALVDYSTIADIEDVEEDELAEAATYLNAPAPGPDEHVARISMINAMRIRQAARDWDEEVDADDGNGRFLSGNWTHIFSENGGDTDTRIVFDREANAVVAMEIRTAPVGEWIESSRAQREDVTDSIVNANPEALDSPVEFSLVSNDAPPMWSLKYIERPPVRSVTERPRG